MVVRSQVSQLLGYTDDHTHQVCGATPQRQWQSCALQGTRFTGQFWKHEDNFHLTPIKESLKHPHLGRGGATHDAGEHSDHVDCNGICVLV